MSLRQWRSWTLCVGVCAGAMVMAACGDPGGHSGLGGGQGDEPQSPAGTVVEQGVPINADIQVGPIEPGAFESPADQARVSMYAIGLSTLAGVTQSSAEDAPESGSGEQAAKGPVGGEAGANALTSPVATATAMAQIALGAQGATRGEYEKLMGMTADEAVDQFSASWALWDQWEGDLTQVQGGTVADTPLVGRSMRMVFDDQFRVDSTWQNTVTSNWDTDVANLDLQSPSAQDDLDKWVNEHSGGMVDKSGIRPDEFTRLVGQNAVVFSAPWAEPFDEKLTRPMQFYTSAGPVKLVDMMSAESSIQGLEDEQWTAGTLPYQGGELALHVLMPHEGTQVTPTSVNDVLQTLNETHEQDIEVYLPKTDFTSSVNQLDVMTRMGASGDLAEGDYSGFGSSSGNEFALKLQQFIQQGHLIVKEEGTVAAAVTEYSAGDTAAAPPDMLTFNHPYLAIIADTRTSTPLFMAWIGDPSLAN